MKKLKRKKGRLIFGSLLFSLVELFETNLGGGNVTQEHYWVNGKSILLRESFGERYIFISENSGKRKYISFGYGSNSDGLLNKIESNNPLINEDQLQRIYSHILEKREKWNSKDSD